jgi:hypothetical protein
LQPLKLLISPRFQPDIEDMLKEGIENVKNLEHLWVKIFLHVSFGICPNITQLSNALEISRNTLKKQLRELGITPMDHE